MRTGAKLFLAFALALGLGLLALAWLSSPAEARRHHRYGWGYGYGWHGHYRHHRSPLARSEPAGPSSSAPEAKPDPAAVYGPPMPVLTVVRTIVNGRPSQPWVGGPPPWAGELHVSPILSGRSAYVRQ